MDRGVLTLLNIQRTMSSAQPILNKVSGLRFFNERSGTLALFRTNKASPILTYYEQSWSWHPQKRICLPFCKRRQRGGRIELPCSIEARKLCLSFWPLARREEAQDTSKPETLSSVCSFSQIQPSVQAWWCFSMQELFWKNSIIEKTEPTKENEKIGTWKGKRVWKANHRKI